MQFMNIVKIAVLVLAVIFVIFCVFQAIKQGFFPFIGCIFICAIGFVVCAYLINKPLFLEYLNKIIVWIKELGLQLH